MCTHILVSTTTTKNQSRNTKQLQPQPTMQQEISLEKLKEKLGVKCRSGQATSVPSIPNIETAGFDGCCNEQLLVEEDDEQGSKTTEVSEEQIVPHNNAPSVSARKLGAALWELHHYHNPSRRYDQPRKDKSSQSSPISIHRCHEIAPSSYNVLNCRIQSLEEQHVTDVSLIRALQKELTQARRQVIDLQRETVELREKIAENKLTKSREKDSVDAAIRLEEERELRKKSETLCRELAKGIYEMKKSLSRICTEVERDRKLLNKLSSDIEDFLQTKRNERGENEISKEAIDSHTLSNLSMSRGGPNRIEGAEQITTAEENSIETQDKCKEANDMYEGINKVNSSHEFSDLTMNQFSLMDRGKMQSDRSYRIASSMHRSYSSPVRQWIEKLPYQNPGDEVSLKLFPRLKESKRIMHQRRDWSLHPSFHLEDIGSISFLQSINSRKYVCGNF